MTWRWLMRLALSLLIFTLLTVAAIPSLRYKAVGRLRGEPFYHGLPYRYWIDSLRDGDAQTRKVFFYGIHKNDAAAVPLLEELLGDHSAELRRAAAEGLGRVGPAAVPSARQLCAAAVGDGDEQVQRDARRALEEMGQAALPALARALDDKHESIRRVAAELLGQLGPPAHPAMPELLRLLDDSDRSVREQARAALDRIGLDRDTATPALRRIMDDQPNELRFWAAETLVALDGAGVDQAIPILVQGLRANSSVRHHAVRSLSKIGQVAVPALLQAARDPDADLRAGAVEALGGIAAPDVPRALFAALKDPAGSVRQQAVYALERCGPAIIPANRAALRDPDDRVRLTVLELLGTLGESARSERDVVRAGLEDPSDGVRKAAAAALVQISPQEVSALVSALVQTFRRGPTAQRLGAIKSLESLGTRAQAAVPALAAALADADPEVRAGAANALGEIGAPGTEAVAALARALKDEHGQVRRHAAAALRKGVNVATSGPVMDSVVAALGDALKDPDAEVRRIAAEALQEMVYQAPDSTVLHVVLPILVDGLSDDQDKVRAPVEDALLRACEKITVEDKRLIPTLVRICQPKARIRGEVSAALAKVLSEIRPSDQERVPEWLVLLEDDATPLDVQTLLVQALTKLGPRAKAAVPVLIETLRRHPVRELRPRPGSPEHAVVLLRLAALYALGAIGPASEPAVPVLIEALEAEEPLRTTVALEKGSAPLAEVPYGVRQTAAYALGRIGPGAKAAIPALTRASESQNKAVRTAAVTALKQIQRQSGDPPKSK